MVLSPDLDGALTMERWCSHHEKMVLSPPKDGALTTYPQAASMINVYV
jgi:hypothetical protein